MQDKKYKASVLAVTLIIMGIVLASALSITTVSIKERKGSIGANKSNQAYQAADLGVEKILSVLKNPTAGNIADIAWNSIGCSCDSITNWIECGSDNYKAQLIDINYSNNAETVIRCNANVPIVNVDRIRSLGIDPSRQTQRAVEASVPGL